MKKVEYETPVVEIIEFEADDIIVSSPFTDENLQWKALGIEE